MAGLVTGVFGTLGFVSLGFLADAFGRKPITMLFYLMCLILTPVVYLWVTNIYVLLFWVAVFGFFTLGIWARGAGLVTGTVPNQDAQYGDSLFL